MSIMASRMSLSDSTSNKRMKLTVHASRTLPSRLRPTSPRKVASKVRAAWPAAYPQRWAHYRGACIWPESG